MINGGANEATGNHHVLRGCLASAVISKVAAG